MIKAAKRFDETRGFKFISYAVWWIRQSILQALAEQSRIVRLPLNQVGSLNKIKKEASKLEQKFERPPSAEELAEALDIQEEKITESFRISTHHVSDDAPLVQGEDASLLDVYVNQDSPNADSSLIYESLAKEIQRSLATLTEKERDVINLYFGIGMNHGLTLDEIGAKFDLTRERTLTQLRRLEAMGFIYRKRSDHRINGVRYYPNNVTIGEPIFFTAAYDRMEALPVIP